MKPYTSLFSRSKSQAVDTIFAFFPPVDGDWDGRFKELASVTSDGFDSWTFKQKRYSDQYPWTSVPKIRNYLDYTFVRLVELEQKDTGKYFNLSADGTRICFNTGLQNKNQSDLIATFEKSRDRDDGKRVTDWTYRGCYAPSDFGYRSHFTQNPPDFAWYSLDSRDFVFNVKYQIDKDIFGHIFERAKERAGMPNAADEAVITYLKGTLDALIPKIRRNYKLAIPVWYVLEQRMQMLLPFPSFSDKNDYSSFLVERDDTNQAYHLKTIFDLDQSYFSARLLTRPDQDWLDP
jgi:hypothetical protein